MKRLTRSVVDGLTDIGRRAVRYLATLGVAARTRMHMGSRVPRLLSVVVPMHDVERYIDASLNSIRRQPYRDIEVIIVDDGSPDRSIAVAARHRRRDPRVRIVQRPNGGPSAARNTGVAAARGEFLTFVDPDDLVRADGLRQAIAALRESGSDFAVLSYDRLERGRRRKPGPWITAAHARRRLRCTVDTVPEIQVNAVVWSKVFRRSFYDAAGIRFPEGAIYEDQPVSARAYARARAFDILTEIGVTWRIRDDGTSITQQTASADNISAHNEAVRASLAELDDAGHTTAADARALQLLANNMRLFSRHVDTVDDEFWKALQVGLRELMARVTDEAYVREVPAQEKVLNELIVRDDRARATEFLNAGGMKPAGFPTERDGSRYVVRLPFFDDRGADLPPDLFVLADRQLSATAMVTAARWRDGGILVIEGCAYIRNVDLAARAPAIEVRAIDRTEGRITMQTTQGICTQPDEIRTHEHCDYRNGGFTARLDTADLDPAGGPWRFEVELVVPGLSRTAPLARTSPSAAASPPSQARSDHDAAFVAGPLDDGGFGLRPVARDPSPPRSRSRTTRR